MHTELISFLVSNPGAGGAAAAAVTGDSLIIKNNRGVSGPRIIDWWSFQQAAGFAQLAFPSGHDTTRGYRAGVIVDDTYSLLPEGFSIPITAQETMTITLAGSGAAFEQGAMLVHYPDLPGVDQRTLTWSQTQDRYEKLTTVFAALTTGTNGQYGTGVAINSGSDLLLANRDYALLGMQTTADVCSVSVAGPDTGYAKIGAPGSNQNSDESAQYFCRLARAQDRSLIPVINSGNKAATLLYAAGPSASATNVTLNLALLRK